MTYDKKEEEEEEEENDNESYKFCASTCYIRLFHFMCFIILRTVCKTVYELSNLLLPSACINDSSPARPFAA